MLAMFHRSVNLNMTYPYFLNSCSAVSPSLAPGPSEFFALVTLAPFQSYFLALQTFLCFRLSGGFAGACRGSWNFIQSSLLPTSRSRTSKVPRRRYHRHYHRRVKFLHHPRPPCPKLPSPSKPTSVPRRLCRRIITNTTSLVSTVTRAFTPSSCLAVISVLPAYFAVSSCFHPSFFHQVVSWYTIACYIFTGFNFARLFRPRPFDMDAAFCDNVIFGSALPPSVQEGDLPGFKPSVVYSDKVESSLLDLYCSIMAQSRFIPGSDVASTWDSLPELSPSPDLSLPDLDAFVASIDVLDDSVAYMAD